VKWQNLKERDLGMDWKIVWVLKANSVGRCDLGMHWA
jgi:hypothetical protein